MLSKPTSFLYLEYLPLRGIVDTGIYLQAPSRKNSFSNLALGTLLCLQVLHMCLEIVLTSCTCNTIHNIHYCVASLHVCRVHTIPNSRQGILSITARAGGLSMTDSTRLSLLRVFKHSHISADSFC